MARRPMRLPPPPEQNVSKKMFSIRVFNVDRAEIRPGDALYRPVRPAERLRRRRVVERAFGRH
ncbi:hypothetical protein ACLB1Q_29655 [Escherichia coli]